MAHGHVAEGWNVLEWAFAGEGNGVAADASGLEQQATLFGGGVRIRSTSQTARQRQESK
jgi:hypothetical protein